MRRRVSIPFALLFVLCIAAGDALGTKLAYRGPKDLAAESPVIVRGRVTSVSSYWNARHTKIFTEARVRVEETYKGGDLREARVLQLGGVVGHVNMRVEGALGWKESEEVLLFLEPGMTGTFNVAGFSQGKFTIERDPRTNRAFVRAPDLADTELLGAPERPGSPARISLDEFVAKTMSGR